MIPSKQEHHNFLSPFWNLIEPNTATMFKYAYKNHSLMKLQFAIVLGVILVGSIATVNMAFVQNNEFSANSLKTTAGIMGHVTLTATDEDGNIIAYRQTDNTIVNEGQNCIAEALFGVSFQCFDATSVYKIIHIGTDSTGGKSEALSRLAAYHAVTGGTVGQPTSALANSGAFVTIQAAFFDVNAVIGEAALRNDIDSNVGDTLALQAFADINLGPTDDLTIDWTITVDG